jgi:hypothetical protein
MCLSNLVINNYIDNVLDKHETMLVKEHLEQCQKCSSLYNSYKVLVTTVQQLPQPEVSDSFFENLFLKIDAEAHPGFEELSAYYDQKGSPEIKEHLVSCAICQEQLNNIIVTSRYFKNI